MQEKRCPATPNGRPPSTRRPSIDAKRGKLFAKLIKNIEVAARTGGGDPAGNPTLYDAIQKAKKSSVPNDNIDRAVKRGSGAEAGGADYQTIMYEGYAPGGVALLIECLTDNRNRAAAEVRTALTRNGGTLADPGSVSYLFNRKGVVVVPKAAATDRGRRPRGRARRRRRGGQRPRRVLRGHLARRPTSSPSARRSRTPASTTTRPRPFVRPEPAGPARRRRRAQDVPCSSTPSRTATTSRTSTPTATSPTRSWRRSTTTSDACRCRVRGRRAV